MDGLVTALVLLAALLHALWNAFLKAGEDKLLSIAAIVVATGFIGLFLSPFVGLPAPEAWPYLLSSVLIHFCYYLFLSQAYRYGEFALVYPMARGTGPLIVVLWSVWVLGEQLSTLQLWTIAGIISGIMVFASRGIGAISHNNKLLLYVLLTAVSIAAYTLVDGRGGRASQNIPAYMVWLSILDVFPILLFTLTRRPARQILRHSVQPRALFAAAVSLAAYWIVVWAMTQAPIALVAALRETSIIIATLIGTFYFKERSGYRRFVAAFMICVSIAVLKIYD